MTGYADTLVKGRVFCGLHKELIGMLAIEGANLRPERVRTLDALLAAIRDAAARMP